MITLFAQISSPRLAKPLAISLLVLLQSCATAPTQERVEQEKPAIAPPEKIADRSISTETLYALMVAEMAIDRKRYDIALNNYVQQALSTRDPLVTSRATQIARILKAHQPALEMAELWVDLEPENTDAQLIATAELIEANRVEEAVAMSAKLLESGAATAFDAIAVKASEGDIEQVRMLTDVYAGLLKSHPEEEQLLLGYSVLLHQDGRDEEALKAISNALKLNPQNIRAAFQETRILQQMGKQDLALQKLAKLVKDNPDNFSLRARYARVVSATDLNESRQQFQALLKQAPNDPEILFSLAIVEKESGRLGQSEEHFKTLLASGYYTNAANYYLGQIYEKKNDMDAALEHYTQVGPSQNFLSAILRASNLLSSSDREIDALTLVREKRKTAEAQYREGLFILESDILSTAGQMSAAELVLSDGLDAFPDSTKMLYARAMLYTRIDYIAAAELDLKKILTVTPDNAAALNALGYTLADRTDRLDEAYLYIKKAYELTPEDPAVIDSMGWVEYRRGNYQEALLRLRQAMNAMPDHEIAAHLGEVLWVTGGKEEAKQIWKQGLELTPQSSVIHKTLHRLKVDLN
ncbi:Tetratricopeptide repeat-containing protein [Alteromonadaceae bacterium Bs31]|nr:Tetratricopeptide repeat-containing protein [Alteromonadaceae bacterium Bs31]